MSSLVAQPRTLVDVLLPRSRSWLFGAALVVAFSVFVALTARVQIPLWPVPITLQTFGVLFTGALLERGWDRRPAWMVLAMVLGNLVIYALGVVWLSVYLGDLGTALAQGMLIFVVGDLLKIAIATLALPGGWALARRHQNQHQFER